MQHQIKINNANINILEAGKGPALLLVHGFPLGHTMWQHQIEPLSTSFRIICPDLPGFGNSELPPQPISIENLADSLAMLLDELKVKTVTFCGLSMGGYIGWQFWKRHPERLDRLIAVDTRAAADNEITARGRRVQAESARQHGIAKLADEMIPKLFAESNLQNRKAEVELIRQSISQTNPATVAQAQLAMADRVDASAWLPEIKIPTLFIVGQHDSITTPEEMRANSEQATGSRFVAISQAGHLSPLENPAEFNQALLDFS